MLFFVFFKKNQINQEILHIYSNPTIGCSFTTSGNDLKPLG